MEIDNLRLSKSTSRVRLNESMYYVIWGHLISAVEKDCGQNPLLPEKH